MSALLQLKGFGVGIGERTILGSIDLDVQETGVTCLFGPSATGKSTLLRTLAGLNDASPNLRQWGEAYFAGSPLKDGERPSMMIQSAKLLASSVLHNVIHEVPERGSLDLKQQRDLAVRLLDESGLPELKECLNMPVLELNLYQSRRLSIMRICASNPKMVCLDEPTTGLSEAETKKLLDFIKYQSEKRAILITLHNQAQAEYLGGILCLLQVDMFRTQAVPLKSSESQRKI
ncbi:MAG: ATP-binding cassette domain-containing protein [Pseudomonadota bacterium]